MCIPLHNPHINNHLNKKCQLIEIRKLANCALWGTPTQANKLTLKIHFNFVNSDKHVKTLCGNLYVDMYKSKRMVKFPHRCMCVYISG